MKTSFSKGEVYLLPVQGRDGEVKIGAEHGRNTEKRRFGAEKWLDNPCGRKIIVQNDQQQSI
jgi:hypothetical protein